MKKFIFLLLVFINSDVDAQFSGDPANPLAICIAAAGQSNVVGLPDNSTGHYVFWIDKRSNSTDGEIYGQHLDSKGHTLWAANGKRIVQSNSTSVTSMRCMRMQNATLITWIQDQDSMFCKLINNNGNDVWPQPVLVARNGSGILSVAASGFNVFPNDSGATITYSYVYTGGSSLFSFNRISFAGVLNWPVNNFLINGLPGYDFRTTNDEQNGFYLMAKGNGLGSTINILHYDFQGTSTWANAVDITDGGGLSGFGGNIDMHADADGNLYTSWDASSGKTLASKLTSQGAFAWNPHQLEMSSIAGTQSRCHSMLRGNSLYVVWNDSHITNQTSLYIQKVDTSGVNLWTSNGVYVGVVNGYYAYPRVTYSDSNSVVCFYLAPGGPIDLAAQRINSDSTLSWSGNGISLSAAASWISYTDYSAQSDASGCNAVFWTTMSGDIYGAKVCSDGLLVNVSEKEEVIDFNIYPVPASEILTVEFAEEKLIDNISIYTLEGKIVKTISSVRDNKIDVDVSSFDSGMYFMTCQINGELISRKLMVSHK